MIDRWKAFDEAPLKATTSGKLWQGWSEGGIKMSSGRDLRQMCRCSSGFEFERSPQYADGTGGGEKCVCDCVSACAPFARVRFRVFGEQIKPLEPQDKSDRRNEEEKEEEEKGRQGG